MGEVLFLTLKKNVHVCFFSTIVVGAGIFTLGGEF